MGRLEPKHWTVIAAYLASMAVTIGGAAHWGDLLTPAAVSGFILQISVLITAIFVGAPPNPKWRHGGHPRRRHYDEKTAINAGSVSEHTRANLP